MKPNSLPFVAFVIDQSILVHGNFGGRADILFPIPKPNAAHKNRSQSRTEKRPVLPEESTHCHHEDEEYAKEYRSDCGCGFHALLNARMLRRQKLFWRGCGFLVRIHHHG